MSTSDIQSVSQVEGDVVKDHVIDDMSEFFRVLKLCNLNELSYPPHIYDFITMNYDRIYKRLRESDNEDEKLLYENFTSSIYLHVIIESNETNANEINELTEIDNHRLKLFFRSNTFAKSFYLNVHQMAGSYKHVITWRLFIEELQNSKMDNVLIRLCDDDCTDLIYTKSKNVLEITKAIIIGDNKCSVFIHETKIDNLIKSSQHIMLTLTSIIDKFGKTYGYHDLLYSEPLQDEDDDEEISLDDVPEYLRQSKYYKKLTGEIETGECFCCCVDSSEMKPNIEVNNMDDFIYLLITCGFWELDYPYTMFDFALSSPENKDDVLTYLYKCGGEDSKSFIKRINSYVRFGMTLEKSEDYDWDKHFIVTDKSYIAPLDGYWHTISISQGDLIWTFSSEHKMRGIFTHIKMWKDFVEDLKNPDPLKGTCIVTIYDYANSSFSHSKDEKEIGINQEVNCDCGELILRNVNTTDLITSCERFIDGMTVMLEKFESKYGYHDELHEEFRTIQVENKKVEFQPPVTGGSVTVNACGIQTIQPDSFFVDQVNDVFLEQMKTLIKDVVIPDKIVPEFQTGSHP